jgi:anti-sigma B factor antagonist
MFEQTGLSMVHMRDMRLRPQRRGAHWGSFQVGGADRRSNRPLPEEFVVAATRPALTVLARSSSRPEQDTIVLHIVGEIDAVTAPALTAALARIWATQPGVVVLDMSEVGFLGTAGLSELLNAAERAEATHASLRLVGGPRCVERALQVAGLSSRLPVCPDLEQAVHG